MKQSLPICPSPPAGSEKRHNACYRMCAIVPVSRQMRALVVDDDDNQRTDLAEMIGSFGITPLTAVDGQDAIEKLDSCNVDVIVTDLMMPGMDGFGLLRHLN